MTGFETKQESGELQSWEEQKLKGGAETSRDVQALKNS
jgi:hypothetical protein